MSVKQYRKKPVVIEAVQWDGRNLDDVLELGSVKYNPLTGDLAIVTLEGVMIANLDDYVIKGIKGELYPCKPDIFEATYEVV